jgi:acyl-coenzyme A thioesterase PaaI-like protein
MRAGAPDPRWSLVTDCGPFTEHVGPLYLRRTDLAPDEIARYGFRVAAVHCNKREICHGGMLATFADVAMARGACFADDIAPPLPTISMSLDFMGPAPLGAWVEAAINLGRIGRGTLFVQAMMTIGGERILRASAVFRRWSPRPA